MRSTVSYVATSIPTLSDYVWPNYSRANAEFIKITQKTRREQNADLNIHFPEVNFIRGELFSRFRTYPQNETRIKFVSYSVSFFSWNYSRSLFGIPYKSVSQLCTIRGFEFKEWKVVLAEK